MVGMDYSKAEEWKITEASFDPEYLGKCESIMCQGNGYLGLRNATDEFNAGEQRNLFVAGTFNKFDQEEVTELPNAADVTRLDLQLDGERFNLQCGEILAYSRDLCLKNGEVLRNVLWKSRSGRVYRLEFRRIVSLERRHVIAQQLRVTPQSREAKLLLCGGIDGRMNNSGSQHFSEGEKRL